MPSTRPVLWSSNSMRAMTAVSAFALANLCHITTSKRHRDGRSRQVCQQGIRQLRQHCKASPQVHYQGYLGGAYLQAVLQAGRALHSNVCIHIHLAAKQDAVYTHA
jgi:hypothetical protein